MSLIIGEMQSFQHNAPEAPGLTLGRCAFNPDGSNGLLGYSRVFASSTFPQMDFNAAGRAIFKAYRSPVRYSFAWSLLLTEDETMALMALISAQNRAAAIQTGDQWPFVQVTDKRLALTDVGSTTRASAEILNVGNGGITYWPVFNVLMQIKSSAQPKLYMNGEWLIELELSGEEAEFTTP